jgi:diguanylate cyclase (GGDEF)-like protein
MIARLGGDEFVILLPETNQEAAQVAVSKIKVLFENEMHKHGWPVTFSIGVLTCLDAHIAVDDLMMKADAVMYSVKKKGKNAIEYAVYTDNPNANGSI